MKSAKFIKKCDWGTGDARLYELSEPVEYDKPWDEEDPPAKMTKYIAVSAANVPFSGPETYIFPADENGEVLKWGELDGSFKGDMDHIKALMRAGFELEDNHD